MRPVRPPGRTERALDEREGNRDHEADDHYVRLPGRSDAGRGSAGRTRTAAAGSSAADGPPPLFANEAGTYLTKIYARTDAFPFGRRTYEIFAGYWGAVADPSINPIATALNSRPKFVVSTTLTDPRWADTTVLSGDVAAAVGGRGAKPGASRRCTAAAH
jgi:hypothetical protein